MIKSFLNRILTWKTIKKNFLKKIKYFAKDLHEKLIRENYILDQMTPISGNKRRESIIINSKVEILTQRIIRYSFHNL